ncbi:MAG: amidohydrolase family protein [Acidimicrobiales bacterium]
MFDLVIRNGTLVDGTGGPAVVADVAVVDGMIVEVGPDLGAARAEIDATGKLVTPGFVDIHTHYDGQATWDEELAPSTPHGVTTLVMGNCGVGFAPARPDRHQFLIELMEGVEDIPGVALSEGISWEWETFPQYLDALERREFAADVAAMIAHGPVRAYVMGRSGADRPATAAEIDAMATIVGEPSGRVRSAFEGGSRTIASSDRWRTSPGTFAAEDELFALAGDRGTNGQGTLRLPQPGLPVRISLPPTCEVDWVCQLAADIKRPVTWLMLQNRCRAR